MVFQCINICQVPWVVLKTAASDLGFQHLPRDLANVNAWKTLFDPYISRTNLVLSWVEHKKSFITSESGLKTEKILKTRNMFVKPFAYNYTLIHAKCQSWKRSVPTKWTVDLLIIPYKHTKVQALAQIIFEISCWQDFCFFHLQCISWKRSIIPELQNQWKKYIGLRIFHPYSVYKISKSLTVFDHMLSMTTGWMTRKQYAPPASAKLRAKQKHDVDPCIPFISLYIIGEHMCIHYVNMLT